MWRFHSTMLEARSTQRVFIQRALGWKSWRSKKVWCEQLGWPRWVPDELPKADARAENEQQRLIQDRRSSHARRRVEFRPGKSVGLDDSRLGWRARTAAAIERILPPKCDTVRDSGPQVRSDWWRDAISWSQKQFNYQLSHSRRPLRRTQRRLCLRKWKRPKLVFGRRRGKS